MKGMTFGFGFSHHRISLFHQGEHHRVPGRGLFGLGLIV